MAKLGSATAAAVVIKNPTEVANSLVIEILVTTPQWTSWIDTKNKDIYGSNYTIVLNNAFDAGPQNKTESAKCSRDYTSTAAKI